VKLLYSPEYIASALSVKRLGGVSYISLAGTGETLIQKEVVLIVHELLRQGHYVNITTNGTLKHRFQELINFDKELLSHLNISFSFHYVELVRLRKIEIFFQNLQMIRNAGCSFVLQINLSDEYLPHWDEIKKLSLLYTGAFPQVALTRDKTNRKFKIFTHLTKEEYINKGNEMLSPLFKFTCKNFNKRQIKFCYAGDWSAILNLYTGEMTSCYGNGINQNIYRDVSKPIIFKPLGLCKSRYCINSSHFLSLGVIPSKDTPTYAQLRNRKEANWYTNEMENFLNQKLLIDNEKLNSINEIILKVSSLNLYLFKKTKSKIINILKKAYRK
jgi:hypothetical protein